MIMNPRQRIMSVRHDTISAIYIFVKVLDVVRKHDYLLVHVGAGLRYSASTICDIFLKKVFRNQSRKISI